MWVDFNFKLQVFNIKPAQNTLDILVRFVYCNKKDGIGLSF